MTLTAWVAFGSLLVMLLSVVVAVGEHLHNTDARVEELERSSHWHPDGTKRPK